MKRNSHWIKQAFAVCLVIAVTPMASAVDEELIVKGTPDRLKSPDRILQGYDAHNTGGYYYKLGKYEKAYPYLVEAAEEGFKMSQARLGYIYQKGLGGVERDWVKAVGWLGVAASRKANPEIMKYWKDLKAKIPDQNMRMVEDIIEEYVSRYGSEATGVKCDINRTAGTHIAYVQCLYDDEIEYRDRFYTLGPPPPIQTDSSVRGGGSAPL